MYIENKVSLALQIMFAVFALFIVHTIGAILAHLWIVSDILLLLGALSVYQFMTNNEFRDEVEETVQAANIGTFADNVSIYLIDFITRIGRMFGYELDFDGDGFDIIDAFEFFKGKATPEVEQQIKEGYDVPEDVDAPYGEEPDEIRESDGTVLYRKNDPAFKDVNWRELLLKG